MSYIKPLTSYFKKFASAICTLIFFLPLPGKNQTRITISLKDAIQLAQHNSLDYKIATYTSKLSFWDYNSYRAGFLPKLSLSATLPDYYRSINMITLPNGENDFVSQNVANSSLNLNVSQNITLTGGYASVSTSLQRIDNLGPFSNKAYTSTPFSVSYFQNNILYNPFRWKKKIEPLKMHAASAQYIEDLEDISYKTIDRYFNLLLANVQLKLDHQNLSNIDTLLKITNARFEIGTVTLNDVLQAKVSLLNAKKSLASSISYLETSEQNLVRYLNLDKDKEIMLSFPDSTNFFNVNVDQALLYARENRSYTLEFKRRKLQAEEAIARTKSETGPSVGVRMNLGLTQTGKNLSKSYTDLLRNQSFAVTLNIPLIDWGVNKSNRKRAEANMDLDNTNINQEQLTLEQEIIATVKSWGMQQGIMKISKETNELASQRYEIAREKFSLGTISYTDFNNAQLEKDRATTDHINNLRNYWALYYMIRKITLHNFENGKKITAQEDE